METRLCCHQLFDAFSHKNPCRGNDVDSVLIAVTLPPAGQAPEQQRDHVKQEIVALSQERQREESQGIRTRLVSI